MTRSTRENEYKKTLLSKLEGQEFVASKIIYGPKYKTIGEIDLITKKGDLI